MFISAMSSALLQILANDKLTEENYTKWKNNINADLKFMLTEECHPQPTDNAARIVREAYQKWISENEKARIYLLASMT